MKTHRFVAEEADVGARLDKFLAAHLNDISRSRLSQWIKEGFVSVDGQNVPSKQTIHLNNVVVVEEPPSKPVHIIPQALELNVVFEDDHIVVVDKPAGVVVHPGAGHPDGTLLNGLFHRFGPLSNIGAPTRPGVVHRIDAGTSGLLVFARTDEAHLALSRQFAAHTVNRTYIALIWGHGLTEEGTVETLYGRSPNHRIKFSSLVSKGKRAVTHWSRIADLGPCDLLRLNLETGRTHQIRVHMADLGYPLVGDPLYGQKRRVQNIPKLRHMGIELGLSRQALHAQTLGFIHPASGELVEFVSDLPTDIYALITLLGGEKVVLGDSVRGPLT